ncbi:MAG TPA: hypothetical protein VNA30_06125 [Mycobacteriales bacterium]|nr:hypothetical protein [Mycobacteriales bacterium]
MTRLRLLALAMSLASVAACSGGDPEPAAPGASASPTGSSAALGSGSTDGETATTTSAAPSAGSTTGFRGSSPAGPNSAAPAPTAGTGTRTPSAAAGRSTMPGGYTYDVSGTYTVGTPRAFKGEATLQVDPPAGSQQHAVLESDFGRIEHDVEHRSTGTYGLRLLLTTAAFSKEFRADPAVLLVPEPAPRGRTWSWTALSEDGKTRATYSAAAEGEETLTIEGRPTRCVVIRSTLRLTGDVDYTARSRTSWSAAHRLAVREATQGSGSYSGTPFASDTTSVIRSVRPR